MRNLIVGFFLGAAVVYWSGHHSETVVQAVTGWVTGAAGNYNSSPPDDGTYR